MACRLSGALPVMSQRHSTIPWSVRPSRARTVLINAVVLAVLLAAVELSARVLVLLLRGSATAGLQERTLNLDYEPFVMYGPGWDARFAAVPRDGLPTV